MVGSTSSASLSRTIRPMSSRVNERSRLDAGSRVGRDRPTEKALRAARRIDRRRPAMTRRDFVGIALSGFAFAARPDSVAARPSAEPVAGAEGEGPLLTPVVPSVPSPPRWFDGDDGLTHLQYELLLTNGVSV